MCFARPCLGGIEVIRIFKGTDLVSLRADVNTVHPCEVLPLLVVLVLWKQDSGGSDRPCLYDLLWCFHSMLPGYPLCQAARGHASEKLACVGRIPFAKALVVRLVCLFLGC